MSLGGILKCVNSNCKKGVSTGTYLVFGLEKEFLTNICSVERNKTKIRSHLFLVDLKTCLHEKKLTVGSLNSVFDFTVNVSQKLTLTTNSDATSSGKVSKREQYCRHQQGNKQPAHLNLNTFFLLV